MNIKPFRLLVLALSLAGSPPARAVDGPPGFVDYQGTVYDSAGNPLGVSSTDPSKAEPKNYTMEFRIWDQQSNGTLVWAETQTVTVSLGMFSVRLGSGAKITSPADLPHEFPNDLSHAFAEKDRYLGLTVKFDGVTPAEITPRLAFQSSPFSFVAQHAQTADKANAVNGVVTAAAGSTFAGGTFSGAFTGGTFTGGTFTGGTFAGSGSELIDVPGTWTVNGGDVYRSTGNVGIGTAVPPPVKLLVAGQIRVKSGPGGTDGTNGYAFDSPGDTDGGMYSSADGQIEFRTDNVERMRINNQGNVGIGTTDLTNAKLNVNGMGGSHSIGNHKFFNGLKTIEDSSTGTHSDASIWASNAIEAHTYRAFSDARIKDIHGRSDGILDLTTLMAIEITNYTYRDDVEKGNGAQKKVIAQQVEKVYPQVVSRSTNVVPDIYKKASITDGWVQLATDLKKGERIRLIGEKTEGIHEVLEVRAGKFRTAFVPEGDKVFVYGREVNDFRVVDYEAIAMLNVSATQQIKKEMDAGLKLRDEKIAALEKRLAEMDDKNREREKRLAVMADKESAREKRLARLEAALTAASSGEAGVTSKSVVRK